jgi:hypothetical protein
MEYWSVGVLECWGVPQGLSFGCSASVSRGRSRKSTLGILLRSPDNDSRFFDCDFRAFFCQPAAQSDSGPLDKLEQ